MLANGRWDLTWRLKGYVLHYYNNNNNNYNNNNNNKGYTSNNRGNWDYFKIIQKIREQHTGKTLSQGTTENSHIGTANILRKVLM